jgi:hypothetical protein
MVSEPKQRKISKKTPNIKKVGEIGISYKSKDFKRQNSISPKP